MVSIPPLKVTSIQSPTMDDLCRGIASYLGSALDHPVEFVNLPPWQERKRLFETGRVHCAWLCGLPYTWKADRESPEIELAAAPVMQSPRYHDRPIYYSDVVVRASAEFEKFHELAGAAWAYNEPQSHSGHNMTCYQLAIRKQDRDFFSRIVEAGSHIRALKLLLEGKVDATALDSTVLDMAIHQRSLLRERIRIIATWGPSPMPPWVIRKDLPTEIRQEIRQALWSMHQVEEGRKILEPGLIKRMDRVEDGDYDPIRTMEQASAGVTLHPVQEMGGSPAGTGPRG